MTKRIIAVGRANRDGVTIKTGPAAIGKLQEPNTPAAIDDYQAEVEEYENDIEEREWNRRGC